MIFCTNCGAQNEPGTQFCTKCGAPLNPTPGSEAPQVHPPDPAAPPIPPASQPAFGQAAFGQPSYGQPQVPQTGQPYPGGYVATTDPMAKSKLVAGLLGIFLGWLGIHRFYLGYKNIAIAQLAVGVIGLLLSPFTCGLILLGASIWGIVDGVMILTGSINTDGFGKPLRD